MALGALLPIISIFLPITKGYVDTSFLGMLKIYAELIDYNPAECIFSIVMIVIFLIFIALTLLFAALNKPIPTIVFDVLAIIVFSLFSGISGAAIPVCYIGAVIVLIGAIIAIIAKNTVSKQTAISE